MFRRLYAAIADLVSQVEQTADLFRSMNDQLRGRLLEDEPQPRVLTAAEPEPVPEEHVETSSNGRKKPAKASA